MEERTRQPLAAPKAAAQRAAQTRRQEREALLADVAPKKAPLNKHEGKSLPARVPALSVSVQLHTGEASVNIR